MRIFVLLLLLLYVTNPCDAQKLVVENPPEPMYNNVYASKNPVKDEKGGYCGVVFVHSTVDGLCFKEAVGEVKRINATYYVYVRSGAKKLTAMSPIGNITMKLSGISPKSATQVTLGTHYDYGTIKLTTVPSGADVYIMTNDSLESLGKSPLKGRAKVLIGKKTLLIRKQGYEDKTIEVEIKRDKETSVNRLKLSPVR